MSFNSRIALCGKLVREMRDNKEIKLLLYNEIVLVCQRSLCCNLHYVALCVCATPLTLSFLLGTCVAL